MSSPHQYTGKLLKIPVDAIRPNEDNPRLNFRQGELEELQESIRQYGIQVPIAVYRKGKEFVLIDGERRWRCASKLNLPLVPALVQEQPGPLQNLLLMFNIHALREQWDLLTIALKLPTISQLLKDDTGKSPTEADLSSKTGLNRGVIRRCRLLMNLPDKYKGMLLVELKKPKSKQELSEDLFIEMERALNAVDNAMPDVIPNRDRARDSLLKKYKTKVIDNIVDFRKIPKIARAQTVNADTRSARAAIVKLIENADYSIQDAWDHTVAEAYAERDIVSRIESLLLRFDDVKASELDDDIREKLEELVRRAQALLESDA
jgi:ParB family chromosome partitioning protein